MRIENLLTAHRTSRFFSLDVMRGIAALAVVFWHWQIFFYVGGRLPPTFSLRMQPLYRIFAPLYQAGYLAVDLFFALSGFIFFALYSDRVASRDISAKQFFVLRLSRLYPLHLATLVFVAVGQAIFVHQNGTYFGSHYNDLYHFLLNLLFASSWGIEKGHSFNGPFWSVSVEALLYVVFFVFSRFCRIKLPAVMAMIALGLLIWPVYAPVGHGIYMFYLGGAACLLYRRIAPVACPSYLPALIAALWLIPLGLALIPAIGTSYRFAPAASLYMRIVVFPVTICLLALLETQRGTLGMRLAVVGDISYSTYLLHFPLQLVFAFVASYLGIGMEVFLSPYALLCFFAFLLPLAYLSHRYLEMPAQRLMRQRWLTSPVGGRSATAARLVEATPGRIAPFPIEK
jgi:peptidoglycan/LPS O-acetylase OafA/YrhL